MKFSDLTLFIYFIFLSSYSSAQDWKLFTGSDDVTDFSLHDNNLWVISGSGLSKINVLDGNQTNWNIVNSTLPDFGYNQMAVDSTGQVWLGGFVNHRLTRFDGTNWQTITNINGQNISAILDLKVTPDGRVWIYGYFDGRQLYYFENNQYHEVLPPDANWEFPGGTLSTIGITRSSHVWVILKETLNEHLAVGEYDGNQWTVHDLESTGIDLSHIAHWVDDSQGNVYMLLTGTGPLLMKYDGIQWQPVDIPAEINDFLNQNRPMYIDRMDRLWIGLWNNSFIRYDGQDWTTINLNSLGLNGGFPDGLFIDNNDVQWFIYNRSLYDRTGYLYRYDGIALNEIDLSNSKIPSNKVGSIVIDRQNNKWMSSRAGLLKFNGTTWTTIPSGLDYTPPPVASNNTGGVWLSAYTSQLKQFDGVTTFGIDMTDPEGMPYDYLPDIAVSKDGKVYGATNENEVLVFDHGDISYLDSMDFLLFGSFIAQDLSRSVALDTSDHLYSMGYVLHRFEDDSTWTEIPLWEEGPISASSFIIAPNNDIWVSHGIILPDRGPEYEIYNGTEWNSFVSPFKNVSYPKWDNHGIMWMRTEHGFCKYENNDWFCYDEFNSPIPAERLDDFVIDDYNNFWISLQDGGLLLFNEDKINHTEGTDLPVVSGTIYRDFDQNGILDPDDTPLALHKALLLPDSIIAFTNYSGSYRLSANPGDHVVKYLPRENWHIDNSPASYDITIDMEPVTDRNFIVAPYEEVVDMRLFLNEGFPRCNRIVPYWMSYGNFGTNKEDGRAVLIKDPKTIFIDSDPNPTSISGDTIIWSFTDLLPFSTDQIELNLKIPGPSFEDSTILLKGYIDRSFQNTLTLQDSFINEQWLSCAYDPNDKIARPKKIREDGKSFLDDPIQYTIRFQNTGNDTAFNIIIRDTLDINLDLNSIEMVGSSHPVEIFLKPGDLLEFRFINILLPDSIVNEPASHGFVSYTISAKKDLPSPTIITNTAHIYFDFNLAIKTNTTSNELVDLIIHTLESEIITHVFKAYPNPASNEIIIELSADAKDNAVAYAIMDVLGRKVFSGIVKHQEPAHVPLENLPQGIYFISSPGTGLNGGMAFIKNNK